MKIATITETTELEKLLPLLSDIEQYYPDILCWYKEKFLHFPSFSQCPFANFAMPITATVANATFQKFFIILKCYLLLFLFIVRRLVEFFTLKYFIFFFNCLTFIMTNN